MKLLLLLWLATALFATSTLTSTRTFSNSDGSTFQGRLQGDAFLHWIETEDGVVLLFNKKSGNFEYAEIIEDDLVLSGIAYKKSQNRSLRIKKDTLNREALKTLWDKRHH
ncbi:MAG: hypothetical protein U9N52_11120 [Campylobacterota bacterium]|nr:hypothetical protein [Campylobacterota bacterium]